MKRVFIFILAFGIGRFAMADVPATQPDASGSGTSDAVGLNELQLRANEDMAKSDYAGALPLLQKVSRLLSDQPDALGPVMEEIRVCQKQINSPTPVAPKTASVVPLVDGSVRKPHVRPADGQVMTIQIKQLGNFDYDAENGGNIPDDVKKLEGCTIKTSGYMIPLDQAESISQFALVPSLFACCFGQPPQIQHTIVVQCPKGKAINYFPDELSVQGKLHVSEQKDGGFIVSIFQLDATSVQPAAQ